MLLKKYLSTGLKHDRNIFTQQYQALPTKQTQAKNCAGLDF
jgi:hypothetical protein